MKCMCYRDRVGLSMVLGFEGRIGSEFCSLRKSLAVKQKKKNEKGVIVGSLEDWCSRKLVNPSRNLEYESSILFLGTMGRKEQQMLLIIKFLIQNSSLNAFCYSMVGASSPL